MGQHADGISSMIKYYELENETANKEQARVEILNFIQTQLTREELLQISANYPHRFPGDDAHLRIIELEAQAGNLEKALKDISVFISNLDPGPVKDRALQLKKTFGTTSDVSERKVAFVGPLTGHYSSFALKVLRGIELAITLNNKNHPSAQCKLVTADTKSNSATIQQIYQNLATKEHVAAVIGPVMSKETIEAAKYAQQYHLPSITPSATQKDLTSLSDYLFRTCLTFEMEVKTLLDYAVNTLQIKDFGILYPLNSYGKAMVEEFQKAAGPYGVQIVHKISYSDNQTEFQETFSALETQPVSALFIPDFPERIAILAPQIPLMDTHQIQLVGPDSWNSEALVKLAGIYVEGAIFTDSFFLNSPNPLVKDFVDSYRSQYNEPPDRLAAQAYDAASVIIKTMNEQGISHEQIRAGLLNMKSFPGISGNFDFLSNGDCNKKGVILSISQGNIIQKNWSVNQN
jgi:branched-chain amino acid transport system substrate-binding protein